MAIADDGRLSSKIARFIHIASASAVPQPHTPSRSITRPFGRSIGGPTQEKREREQRERKREKTHKIQPVRRRIIRQPLSHPTYRWSGSSRTELARCSPSVRHGRLARLRHPRPALSRGRRARWRRRRSLRRLFGGLWGGRVSAWVFFFLVLGFRKGEGRNELGSMMMRGEGGGVHCGRGRKPKVLLRSGGASRWSVEQCRL